MKDEAISLKWKQYLSYFLMILGVIVFCLGITSWAYTFERIVLNAAAQHNANLSLSDADTYLGLSIVGFGMFFLGLIILIDRILPPERQFM